MLELAPLSAVSTFLISSDRKLVKINRIWKFSLLGTLGGNFVEQTVLTRLQSRLRTRVSQ